MGNVLATYNYGIPHFFDSGSAAVPGASLWERYGSIAGVCDPQTLVQYSQDFVGVTPATNTINGWTVTAATSGSVVEDTALPGGIVAISAGAVTAGQGINWQMSSLPFKIASGKPVAFEIGGKFSGLSTTPKVQFFVGLAEATTALITSNAFATKVRVGIGGVSTTGVLGSMCRSDSTAVTGTGVTVADATYYRLGFFATSTQVDFYVNGAVVNSITTQIPTTALAPTIVVQANATVTPVFNLDFIRVGGYR